MAGPLVHVGASVLCPHGGQASVVPGNPRVLVSGQPVATAADLLLIAGCVFSAGPKPQPCVTGRWLVPAMRVLAGGAPVITQSSVGLCQSPEQIPNGPPIVAATQPRVSGI